MKLVFFILTALFVQSCSCSKTDSDENPDPNQLNTISNSNSIFGFVVTNDNLLSDSDRLIFRTQSVEFSGTCETSLTTTYEFQIDDAAAEELPNGCIDNSWSLQLANQTIGEHTVTFRVTRDSTAREITHSFLVTNLRDVYWLSSDADLQIRNGDVCSDGSRYYIAFHSGSELTIKEDVTLTGTGLVMLYYDEKGEYVSHALLSEDVLFNGLEDVHCDSQGHLLMSFRLLAAAGSVDLDPQSSEKLYISTASDYSSGIAKYDKTFELLWSHFYNKSPGTISSYVSFTIDGQDNVIASISFNGSVYFDGDTSTVDSGASTGWDVSFLKLDSEGQLLQQRLLSGDGSDVIVQLEILPNGNILYSGAFSSSSLDVNPEGSAVTLSTAGSFDVFFGEVESTNFAHVWTKDMGGTGIDRINSITVGSDGVYGFGHTDGTLNLNYDTNTNPLVNSGTRSCFAVKFSLTGEHLWSHGYPAQNCSGYAPIFQKSNGDIIIGTSFSGPDVNLDENNSSLNFTHTDNVDAVLLTLSASGEYRSHTSFTGRDDSIDHIPFIAATNDQSYVVGIRSNASDADIDSDVNELQFESSETHRMQILEFNH